MSTPGETARSNPFSTRFIRPGAIPFLFRSGEPAEQLVARLAEHRWRGQIVGPHGSGKSTLLAKLEEPLRVAGRRIWKLMLQDGERRMPHGWAREANLQEANQIVIDGYEQLSRLQRFATKLTCRRSGWGLLVTAHQSVGLPTIYQTAADVDLAQRVVDALLTGEADKLPAEQIAVAYEQAGGNLRESLFLLYDVWEARHRAGTK